MRVCSSTEVHEGWERFSDLGSDSARRARAHLRGDDIHRLMYTSGTTGRPKGVMITHANLAWKNYAHITEFGFTSADVGLACGPLYHVGALDLVTTTMIAVGATTDHPPHLRRRARRRRDRAVPRDHDVDRSRDGPRDPRAYREIEQRDLSSVRLIIAGGEKMPIPFIERLRATFPSAWFADAYGLTETVSGDTFLDRDEHACPSSEVSAGPCQYLELDIWDEHGASVPPGERGEVVLRGPKVFQGYWRTPTRRLQRSPAAGSTPATSACRMTTDTSTSSIDSRT